MTFNKDKKDEPFKSSELNGSYYFFPENSFENNDSGGENQKDNSLISFHQNLNNPPQNEYDNIGDDGSNDILNFHPSIDLNENNSQNENDIIEDGRINDSFNLHSLIDHVNLNNSQFENDNIENESNSISDVHGRKHKIFTIQKNANISNSNSKEIEKRNDYIKKYFKTYFSKFLKKLANKVNKKSQLPKKFKKQKIYSPNSLSFTANTKKSDDYKFLSFTIQEILSYYKKEKYKNKYQKKNKETIENIMNFIEGNENKSKYEEVKFFYNMTLEQAYELFYKDEEFRNFKEDERVIKIDEEVKVINGVSLREKNGFIQLLKREFKEN
jgi:hypothetical protein